MYGCSLRACCTGYGGVDLSSKAHTELVVWVVVLVHFLTWVLLIFLVGALQWQLLAVLRGGEELFL